MKIYLQRHTFGAGYWIYSGYMSAWTHHGFRVELIDSLKDIKGDEEYALMITSSLATADELDYIKNSTFCVLHCAPSAFPKPWGDHPNFRCALSGDLTKELNNLPNIIKWTFGDLIEEHFPLWSNLVTVPLAFDSLNYTVASSDTPYLYDVCFIGGVADNGFNEKIHIIRDCLSAFVDSDLNCCFSVSQNLSHVQENQILMQSKICLNIHDEYQRVVKNDVNERTFKSLGVNGLLVSDETDQLRRLFPDVFISNDSNELVEHCRSLVNGDMEDLNNTKLQNRNFIKKNHTYIKRVEQLLSHAN